jgi:hypothetical protein
VPVLRINIYTGPASRYRIGKPTVPIFHR